jgi:thymidylate kinase
MIVEFAGCTGAGKTTLTREVYRRLAKHVRVTTSYELAAGLVGLGPVTNPTLRNLVQDLVGLPFFLGGLVRHRAFVAYAFKALGRQSSSLLLTANYVRSIARRIGMYEIGRRAPPDRIILVDEGTVLSAHLLFVFGRNEPSQEEIEAFAALVPLPDMIVTIRAPAESLVQRALQRADRPREMRSKDEMEVEAYLSRAVALFDRLTKAGPLRERVLVVDNAACGEEERGAVADRIATAILDRDPVRGQRAALPAGRIGQGSVVGDHRAG